MNDRILHIEKLRALSIALVFLFHLEVVGFHNGFLGVDVFFVISGFLMAKLYGHISSSSELIDYFLRRMARILPAYYATIIFAAVISFFLLLPHEIQMVMKQSIWAAFFLPNIGYWLDTSYFDHTNLRPLLNLWSLGVEVQFYLLFPFLLFIARRSSVLLLILALGSAAEYALLTVIDPDSAFYLLPGRLWEFLAGYYAAQLMVRLEGRRIPHRGLLGLSSVVLLLLIVLLAPSVARDYTFPATLAVIVLTVAAIVLGFSTGSEDSALSKSLVSIGKYSYSIYLIHFPVIVFVMYSPFGGTDLTSDGIVSSLLAVALTALLTWFCYHIIELRTRHSMGVRQLLATASVFCVTTVAIASPVVRLSQQIVDPVLWNMSNALNDRDEFRCAASTESPRTSERSCLIGDLLNGTERQVLLVGDSHADAIKHTLASYLADSDISLRLMSENKAVAEDYPVSVIVEEAARFGIETIVAHSMDNEVRPEALAELARQAADAGMNVVFLDPVPKYAFNVPARLLDDYRNTHELTLAAERVLDVDTIDQIQAIADRYESFIRFPSLVYFCAENSASVCRVSDEFGRPYYSDSNHLTHTGAALLLPVFAEIGRL